jgi:ABC-type sugar transport system permease subunit
MALEGVIEREERQIATGTPWWERNLAWLLVAPTIVLFVIFSIIPAITTVSYAFSRVKMARGGVQQQFAGLDNFVRAIQDPLVAQSAWTTIKWMAVVTVVEITLGLALALLLSGGIRGRGVFSSLLIIPIIMPPVAVSVAWLFMYDY